jgi:hypothetical protein
MIIIGFDMVLAIIFYIGAILAKDNYPELSKFFSNLGDTALYVGLIFYLVIS